ncbi:hypothetical protein MGLY_33740 [Neomoorella glycerini]|uniref:ACT domain-containing protein n=1 Tax=Neomoorella glycerini TaxID=55779 RepID=A0A6I5ZW83_9FIRM|nr:ACT domain-containing protein [Moorella glycerini]QGP93949.1 hypothetical protein MGLY_33740 [Moorella glycerini]
MRLRLQFADRVGMIADVARVVSRHGLNILSLEVIPDNMYLEIEAGPASPGKNSRSSWRPFRGSATSRPSGSCPMKQGSNACK